MPPGEPSGSALMIRAASRLASAGDETSMATADGTAGLLVAVFSPLATDCFVASSCTASSANSSIMAPLPSETCSVSATPMDGSVTVPTTVNRWVSGQIRT